MPVQLAIALTHLLSRKRQTLVSLTGIVLGVAFFLAVSSLMRTVNVSVRVGMPKRGQLRGWGGSALSCIC